MEDEDLINPFFEITSRVNALRAQLEAEGWIYVGEEIVDDPQHPAPDGETMTKLTMRMPAG